MMNAMTDRVLQQENADCRGSGGISSENRSSGLSPAFLDGETGRVHRSRFADGRPAPVHVLDGLPDELVLGRNSFGRVTRAKASVCSGFVRNGRFYTREQAAREVSHDRGTMVAYGHPY
jgi:hypothetical protein